MIRFMEHAAILVLILTLGVGLASVALCAVLENRYRLPFLKHYLFLLIWFNTILLFNIFFNYAQQFFFPILESPLAMVIDISYRLAANILLLMIAISAVTFLRKLLGENFRGTYKNVVVSVWAVLMVAFFASLVTMFQSRAIPLPTVVNALIDLLVILLVLGEMIRAAWKAKAITEPGKRTEVGSFCRALAMVWAGVVLATFALVFGWVSNEQNLLMGSLFGLLFNALPLLFLKPLLGNWDTADRRSPAPLEELLDRHKISKREREVVALICRGLTNKEIADHLCVSEQTIKDHNYRIYRKLGVSNRVQLTTLVSGASARRPSA
ncbi:MAG: LuxR C-terminal-related transcriptional regulator [Acidobacteriota bacterium]|nr:LuxR C-terminal-related transcriptional regulator [Acidobacteriota bacterium]